jgi:hypothetical protein
MICAFCQPCTLESFRNPETRRWSARFITEPDYGIEHVERVLGDYGCVKCTWLSRWYTANGWMCAKHVVDQAHTCITFVSKTKGSGSYWIFGIKKRASQMICAFCQPCTLEPFIRNPETRRWSARFTELDYYVEHVERVLGDYGCVKCTCMGSVLGSSVRLAFAVMRA